MTPEQELQLGKWMSAKLWRYFEFELPDTPGQIAAMLIHQLKAEGWNVMRQGDPVTPIMRTTHE